MAANIAFALLKTRAFIQNLSSFHLNERLLHSSPVCLKVRSGKVKMTPKKNKPITYEMANEPYRIAHAKSWNSWNTSTLEGGLRVPETLFDDAFIRKFITGTFISMVSSEIIIKRQHNIIRIIMILFPNISSTKLCFLIGYSEEILSYWLQCPVKLEIQTIGSFKDVVFKYV